MDASAGAAVGEGVAAAATGWLVAATGAEGPGAAEVRAAEAGATGVGAAGLGGSASAITSLIFSRLRGAGDVADVAADAFCTVLCCPPVNGGAEVGKE